MSFCFVSDLHLEPSRPAPVRRFIDFLGGAARSADAVYILGDLFEAWIGDDDDDPGLKPILESLRGLTKAGVPCHFMHGNRDFLVGPRFAEMTGVALLGDYEVIEVENARLLLTHGDLLCTDDTRYMSLREQLRDPNWQREFLAKSLSERRAIARELRNLSQTEMEQKAEAIMDVNEAAVRETMRRFGVSRLLHGHTHRPAVHRFELDGSEAMRVVLGDWYENCGYARWDANGLQMHELQ